MENFSYVVKDVLELRQYLMSPDIKTTAENSKAVFVQAFSSHSNKKMIKSITEVVTEVIPYAIVVGSTSVGEIKDGLLHTGSTVLSISFFENTIIKPIAISRFKGDEYRMGQNLIQTIKNLGSDIAGVLVLATPMSVDISELFKGMSEEKFDFPIFGGGAGVYNRDDKSFVFYGNDFYNEGVIATVFLSRELQIYTKTILGWKPLSKEMTITDIDGFKLKKVDDVCAFDIYNRYLDIQNDDSFFNNVLEFPLIVERNGEKIARVPFFVDENGYIEFLADLELGEKFHIGYGDPDTIVQKSTDIQKELYGFQPDAIFLYACICRRFLMQNEVNLETQTFDFIAPTAGFYTYGEFFSNSNKIHLLNSTMVVVGMREDNKRKVPYKKICTVADEYFDSTSTDPFSNKHNRIVSKLLHFISVVSYELEQTNLELTRISGIDKLTQINNRLKLDEILQNEIYRSERNNSNLSVAILDMDYFKRVNDDFGHLVGDEVLVRVASILKSNVRESDTVGRWGGEEFLIILSQTSAEDAMVVAEKIRVAVCQENFKTIKHITCSIGVTSIIEGDYKDKMLLRADKALYTAKNSGRNKVVFSDSDEAFFH